MTPGFVEQAILTALRAEVASILDEETTAAVELVRVRIAAVAPRAALTVFKTFEINQMVDHLVIRVRNDFAGGTQ